MNSRIFLNFVALVMVLTTTACFEENMAPEAVMVQPGTTTRPLGPLSFKDPHLLGDNNVPSENAAFTRCSMAANAGSIALVEFGADSSFVARKSDCTGPYSGDALITQAQVYGVAAGEALPSELDLVYNTGWAVNRGHTPKAGDVWLVTVRQAGGEWFLVRALPVTVDLNGSIAATPSPESVPVEGFPSDFYELSNLLVEDVNHLTTRCPSEAARRWDDESFQAYFLDPTARPGSNCHPDDGPQQQNSSAIDEEDLPPNGGTDDSIQP